MPCMPRHIAFGHVRYRCIAMAWGFGDRRTRRLRRDVMPCHRYGHEKPVQAQHDRKKNVGGGAKHARSTDDEDGA